MPIKFAQLSRPVKMGKTNYHWLLNCKSELTSESYKELTDMVARQSVKGFYHGYGNAILFQDKSDAQYFAMQATFIKSREPEKIQMTNTNWKSSYLYNYGLQVKNSSPAVIASGV